VAFIFVSCSSEEDKHEEAVKIQSIVDGTLTVSAGSFQEFRFEVTSRMRSPAVSIDFEVLKGTDVEVLIFDDIAFKNWKAGLAVNANYFSGRIAADRRNVFLSTSGAYSLVVSNIFSVITSKTVKINAVLLWGG